MENEKDNKLNEGDHRSIGKELGLFTFSDVVGKGLPLYTDKGATIRRELERFIVNEEIKRIQTCCNSRYCKTRLIQKVRTLSILQRHYVCTDRYRR